MRLILLIGFAASLALPASLSAQSANESVVHELTDLKNRMLKAEFERNTAFLQEVFAREFIYGMTTGDVMTKKQMLARVKSPTHVYKNLQSDDEQVRVYENVAIMTDHTTTMGTNNGHPFGGDFRFVRIFVKQHGKWRVVLEQGTQLREAPEPK